MPRLSVSLQLVSSLSTHRRNAMQARWKLHTVPRMTERAANRRGACASHFDGLDPASSDADENRIRQIVQDQIIECLNRFYAIETSMWGKPINALILRTIIQGKLQERPYDLSSLSESLELPLTTIHRKVHELVQDGYVEIAKDGKSMQLMPTQQTKNAMDQSFEDMLLAVRRLYNAL